jgi:hypothetical protein
LSDRQLHRLDEASKIELGYPHDFLATGMVRQHIYGGMFDLIDNHRAAHQLASTSAAKPPTPKRTETETDNESDNYLEEFVN